MLEKLKKLEKIKETLKSEYVGIDDIIDEIVENVKGWYVTPEVIQKPLIVNLWGMTGTGKTSVVRRFCDLLEDKQTVYIDGGSIQAESNGYRDYTFTGKIQDNNTSRYLSKESEELLGLEPKDIDLKNTLERGILIIDEFQNCRTIDENGLECENAGRRDMWTALDSGVITTREWWRGRLKKILDSLDRVVKINPEIGNIKINEDLSFQLKEDGVEVINKIKDIIGIFTIEALYDTDDIYEDTGEGSRDEFGRKKLNTYKRSLYSPLGNKDYLTRLAEQFSNIDERVTLKMSEELAGGKTLSEVLTLLRKYQIVLDKECLIDMSKCLIFVLGNLDEAFRPAGANEVNADIDADSLYNFTSSVNIVKIKKALAYRFKQEQIGRLGNNIIIYPSLSKDSFKKIIKKELGKIADNFRKSTGVELNWSPGYERLLYSEGVYPIQGARCIQSTVVSFTTPFMSQGLQLIEESKKTGKFSIYLQLGYEEVENIDINLDNDTVKINLRVYCGDEKIAEIGKQKELVLGKIRQVGNNPNIGIQAVHEMGHAVVYFLTSSNVPDMVIAAGSSDGGIMIKKSVSTTHIRTVEEIENSVRVSMAGWLAEKVVFGDNPKYNLVGSGSDIEKAWRLFSDSIYNGGLYGFRKTKSTTHGMSKVGVPIGMDDIDTTTGGVKSLIQAEWDRLMRETKRMLKKEKKLICEAAIKLTSVRKMDNLEIEKVFGKYGTEHLKDLMRKNTSEDRRFQETLEILKKSK